MDYFHASFLLKGLKVFKVFKVFKGMSDADLAVNGGVRVVIFEVEVGVCEIEDVFYIGIDDHPGKGAWLPEKLLFHLLDMVEINMGISQSVDEVAGL